MKNPLKIFTFTALLCIFQLSGAMMPETIGATAKFKIMTPPADAARIKVITIHTGNMPERMDPNYLGMQLRLTGKGYYGLEAESGNPMTIRLYMNINEPVDEKFLKAIVEQKELQMPVHGGGTKLVEINFSYVGMEKTMDTITRKEFLVRQFDTYSKIFSKNTEKWGGKNEAIYEIEYLGLDKPMIARSIPFLSSYLSQTDGFLGIKTLINDNEEYAFRITYSSDVLNDDKIWEALTNDKWKSVSQEGEIIQIDPKLSFTVKGATLSTKKTK